MGHWNLSETNFIKANAISGLLLVLNTFFLKNILLIVGWNLGRDDAYNQILEQIRGLLVENLKDRKILIRWRLISYLKKINDVTKKYEEIQITFIQNHRWYSSWLHPGYDEFEW